MWAAGSFLVWYFPVLTLCLQLRTNLSLNLVLACLQASGYHHLTQLCLPHSLHSTTSLALANWEKIFGQQKYINTIFKIESVLSLIGVLKVHKILNNTYITYNTCFSTLLVDKFHKGLHQNCFSALVDINFKFWLWFILAIHNHLDSVYNPPPLPALLCRGGHGVHAGRPHCHGRTGGTGCIRLLLNFENVRDTLFTFAKRFQIFFVK